MDVNPPPAKRPRAEGFLFGKSFKKRLDPLPGAAEIDTRTLEVSLGNPNTGGTVEFKLSLNENEWARFTPTPFSMEYEMKVKNPKYVPGKPNDIEKGSKFHYLTAKTDAPCIIFPADLGLSALYSRAEVYVDGLLIGTETDLAGHANVYQSLNRLFATAKQKRRLNQDSSMTTSKDRTAVPTAATNAYKMAAERSEHWDKISPESVLSDTFTMDGTFAISPPRTEALATLEGGAKYNSCNFFPPHTTVLVRLHPRQPRLSMLDYAALPIKDVYSNQKPELDQRIEEPVSFYVRRLQMTYELAKLRPEQTKLQLSRPLHYNHDAPFMDKIAIEAGHQQVVVTSMVPLSARMVFICFMKEQNLWYNELSGKNMHTYYAWPENLAGFSARLEGHGNLFIAGGIKRLGGRRASSNTTCRAVYSSLKSKGLLDMEFFEFFPKRKHERGLHQALAADLRPYGLKKEGQITITMDFDGSFSPGDTKLIVCYSVEKILTRHGPNKWTLKTVD